MRDRARDDGLRPRAAVARNLVVICLDTVRFDVFGALDEVGDDALSTWSERAVVFENATSTAPWTVPAVASVLTGQSPNRHGAGASEGPVAHLGETVPNRLRDDVPTLAERLASHGFASTAVVAHAWFKTRFGLDRGFDRLDLAPHGEHVVHGAQRFLADRSGPDAPPFFLYLHFMDAHAHLTWPRAEKRARAAQLTAAQRHAVIRAAPADWCERPYAARCRHFQAYAHAVAQQRESIARVLEALEAAGRLDDTLVVLYSDHGEEFHDHLEQGRAIGGDPRDTYGFGHGHAMFQEVLHVPLLMWLPGSQGRSVEARVSLADITPSALDWLGLSGDDAGFDGRSLRALVDGEGERFDDPVYASSIAFGPEQITVLRGDLKRTVHLATGDRSLYDLGRDPDELDPLDRHAAARELDRLLERYRERSRPVERRAPRLTPAEVHHLQSLGYLEQVEPE